MPKILSPNWDENQGICILHFFPQLPCSVCMNTKDKDVYVVATEMDKNALDWDDTLTFQDFLPIDNADWLIERVL